MNQINQINKTNQINQTNQRNERLVLCPRMGKADLARKATQAHLPLGEERPTIHSTIEVSAN
jgi:hypothetical protein